MSKPIPIRTTVTRRLADAFTPVSVYLRLRDRFRDTVLLESTEHGAGYSFIGVNAIAGIEINSRGAGETKTPGKPAERFSTDETTDLSKTLWAFLQRFNFSGDDSSVRFAQGLYGHVGWDAIPLVENIGFQTHAESGEAPLPKVRLRLYQYLIVFDHTNDELLLLENETAGLVSERPVVEARIRHKDMPQFPFVRLGEEEANMPDENFLDMVEKGKFACRRGDVFQIVVSRRYLQPYRGDDFNVYRALRHINPSPYLFYFDYGDYKLMGSSPEAQCTIRNAKASLHPIAGTYRRSGNVEEDNLAMEALKRDAKEAAEHNMLVDLARNDLSRTATNVAVSAYRELHTYSHVMHLVSEVQGDLVASANPFATLFSSFPAGTLSGAPKYRALELIDAWEPTPRGAYGGCIGYVGANGDCNMAIVIRSFACRGGKLYYQAGAGVVAASDAASEKAEVDNKLRALRTALSLAEKIEP